MSERQAGIMEIIYKNKTEGRWRGGIWEHNHIETLEVCILTVESQGLASREEKEKIQ